MRIPDAKLAELEEVESMCAPAPWVEHEGDVFSGDVTGEYMRWEATDFVSDKAVECDARFIAAARNAFSDLLADLREYRAALGDGAEYILVNRAREERDAAQAECVRLRARLAEDRDLAAEVLRLRDTLKLAAKRMCEYEPNGAYHDQCFPCMARAALATAGTPSAEFYAELEGECAPLAGRARAATAAPVKVPR